MGETFILPMTPEEMAMALTVAAAVVAVAGLFYRNDRRREAEQRIALKAFAERLHFDRKPGETTEDSFEILHQGWLLCLGMRQHALYERMKGMRPTLHVNLEPRLPRDFEAIPKVWEWGLVVSELKRCFKVGNEVLDKHFDWLCERGEHPRAKALMSHPDVQRALVALCEENPGSVRIEKNQLILLFGGTPDEASLSTHLDALVAVAKALRLAMAPARDGTQRGA